MSAANISFQKPILSHWMLLCNVIMSTWRQSHSRLKLPLYTFFLTDTCTQMWTDRAWPVAERQPGPVSRSLSLSLSTSISVHSSLINPLYRFLIFIYLPECAFLPLQVLQQIPLDTSSLLLPNPVPAPPKNTSIMINFYNKTLLSNN